MRRPNKWTRWVGPVPVAALGLVVVTVLLITPVEIGPGNHGTDSCGNAFAADLSRWQNSSDGPYLDMASRACSTKRIDQIALAVWVLAATVLGVTVLRRGGIAADRSKGGAA